MSTQIAVSFEGGYAKVSYGSQRNGNLVIRRTLKVREDDFDAFLAHEKIKDFIVVSSFQTFYQDVLLLPPVEGKYLDALIETEIKKNAPELKDFVFFSTILKDKIHEGRPVKEIFVFAVNSREGEPLLEKFSRYGKRIKRLYADVFVLSHLIAHSENVKEKTTMCMIDGEGFKTLFLLREGKLVFVRSIQSRGRGIDQYDMTNVNMTVNYARQTLREHPEHLIVASASADKDSIGEGLALPVSFFRYPPTVMVAEENAVDFATPVAALFLGNESAKESLLPKAYTRGITQERILRYASVVFLIVSFLCLGYIVTGLNQTRQIHAMIEPLKQDIEKKAKIYEEFEMRNKEFQEVLPYINYLNGESSAPDIQRFLVGLQTLNRQNVKVREIEIKNTGQELAVHIKGSITTNTYGDLQSCFRRLTDDIKAVSGIQNLSEKLDLANKDFSIGMTWKQ